MSLLKPLSLDNYWHPIPVVRLSKQWIQSLGKHYTLAWRSSDIICQRGKKTHCWVFKCHMPTLLCDVIMLSATSFDEVDLIAELYILMVCIETCNYVVITSAARHRVCFHICPSVCLFVSVCIPVSNMENMMNWRKDFRYIFMVGGTWYKDKSGTVCWCSI